MPIATPLSAEAISELEEITALIADDRLLAQHASGQIVQIRRSNIKVAAADIADHASDADHATIADFSQNFDIVIDSDAKLDQWAQCIDGSLKSVYIKRGIWTASELSPTAGVLITLDAAGTLYVFAEKGAAIAYSGSYNGVMYGLYRSGATSDMCLEQFINVQITLNNTQASTGQAVGIKNCTNLSNCSSTTYGTSTTYAYQGCVNLTRCMATATSAGIVGGYDGCANITTCTFACSTTGTSTSCYGFYNCTNLLTCTGTAGCVNGYSYGFYACIGMSYCTGNGSSSGTGQGFCFFNCKKMQQNYRGSYKTSAYSSCYADSQTANSCADTAAGGYNS